jgi:hypothetical protein
MTSITLTRKPYFEKYKTEKRKYAFFALSNFRYFFFGAILISPKFLFSQSPIKYDVFDKPVLGQMQVLLPGLVQIKPVSPYGLNSPASLGFNTEDQNKRIIQQQNLVNPNQVSQQAKIERDLMEDDFYRKHIEWLANTKAYRNAFNDLLHLNPDSFSLTRAEFDVENAYLDDKLSYDKFLDGVKLRASHVKQILKREKLSTKNSLALNYGIQELFQHSNSYYDNKTKKLVTIRQLKYEFEDYKGEKDLANVFTAKLMATGKGQCLSMPRLYLMIAEQLGAKAWLSLAPQHSYVQFMDSKGRLMNFETTNGNLASGTWLAQSGYINAKAVKNKMYLDTLSQKQLYAQCLADLLYGYLNKLGYDEFAEEIKNKIFQIDPNNMRALIIDANIKRETAFQKIKAAGKPKPEDLDKYPEAFKAYGDMKAALDKVDDMGYQDMPPEAYQRWLQSMEQEKKKQTNKALNDRMQRQIQLLKETRSTLITKPKG